MNATAEAEIQNQGAVRESRAPGARISDFYRLTKPGITRMVLLTSAAGFYLGGTGSTFGWILFVHALIGIGLASSGAGALNQYLERELDAKMHRTRDRPLPAGRLDPEAARSFALALCVAGVVYLWLLVNVTTAVVVALTIISYAAVYTPLKRRTSLSTLVGAVPGALPIVAGWTAAGGSLGTGAWTLFWILFLWQIPHFLALAYIYREDYRRAGFVMLTLNDEDGATTARQALLYGLTLLPVSLMPTLIGVTGSVYYFGALTLGVGFAWVGLRLSLAPSERRAAKLFLASVVYLPVLLLLMVVDTLPV